MVEPGTVRPPKARKMHWTLVLLIFLCGLCAGLNAVQIATTRSIRTVGVLICLAWAVQQGYWLRTGGDSIILFALCDVAIIAWFLSRSRAFDLRERLIAAMIPLTTAFGAYAWLRGGHTPTSWWANLSLVAGQMVLGLPTPKRQKASGSVSHGSMRRGDA